MIRKSIHTFLTMFFIGILFFAGCSCSRNRIPINPTPEQNQQQRTPSEAPDRERIIPAMELFPTEKNQKEAENQKETENQKEAEKQKDAVNQKENAVHPSEKLPLITPLPTPVLEPTKKEEKANLPTVKIVERQEEQSDNMEREAFANALGKLLSLPDNETASALLHKMGILVESDEKFLTRNEAFLALMLADMQLSKTQSPLLSIVKDNQRISDLNGFSEKEKAAAYYVYANGIVEGDRGENFSTARKLNGGMRLKKQDAEVYLLRLKNKEKRFLLSPDGQCLRTTNLPEFAEWYPYILDSFPNEYYAWEFQFMKYEGRTKENLRDFVFTAPKEVGTESFPYTGSVDRYRNQYGALLKQTVEEYLKAVFNVDYRTTPYDEQWRKTIEKLNYYTVEPSCDGTKYGDATETFHYKMKEYLTDIKNNHTIIECDKVACDISSIYKDYMGFVIRCYAHYRFLSADSVRCIETYRNPTIFTPMYTVGFGYGNKVVLSEWRDGYFDVHFSVGSFSGEATTPYIVNVLYSDYLYNNRNIFKETEVR